jgi:transcriptional regulator with XRE-family HTH domain
MGFGERIRARRVQLGLSQLALATRLETSPMQVSRWERQATSPVLESVAALADALDCTLDWLVAGRGEPPPPPAETLEESGTGTDEAA